jgi:hypothetical protein
MTEFSFGPFGGLYSCRECNIPIIFGDDFTLQGNFIYCDICSKRLSNGQMNPTDGRGCIVCGRTLSVIDRGYNISHNTDLQVCRDCQRERAKMNKETPSFGFNTQTNATNSIRDLYREQQIFNRVQTIERERYENRLREIEDKEKRHGHNVKYVQEQREKIDKDIAQLRKDKEELQQRTKDAKEQLDKDRDRIALILATWELDSKKEKNKEKNKENINPNITININNTTQSEPIECSICCDEPCDGVIDPCGHMKCCATCALKQMLIMKPCPFCRGPITKVIKVYP